MPFEPELDWSTFAVRIKEEDIPILHLILDAIDEGAYKRKQAALRCGAQHLMFSAGKGALINETGQYDAFETSLEVVRAHIMNPGVPPEDLQKVDPGLRRFMQCGTDEMGLDPHPSEQPHTPAAVCTWSSHPNQDRPHCSSCRMHKMARDLWGNALCCGREDLSVCPRLLD